MPSHFVGLARAVPGTKNVDFTTGVATNAANMVEVRLDDASGYRAQELEAALLSLRKFFQNPQNWATAGFVIQP